MLTLTMSWEDEEVFSSLILEGVREDVPCHRGKASPDMRSAASTSSDGECTDAELIGLVTASKKNHQVNVDFGKGTPLVGGLDLPDSSVDEMGSTGLAAEHAPAHLDGLASVDMESVHGTSSRGGGAGATVVAKSLVDGGSVARDVQLGGAHAGKFVTVRDPPVTRGQSGTPGFK